MLSERLPIFPQDFSLEKPSWLSQANFAIRLDLCALRLYVQPQIFLQGFWPVMQALL
jgi:hypothetical protein